MKLYKNVDICDLKSICEKGILSLNKSGNNNWEDGNRVNNSADVVYLFSATGEFNSFPQYGSALVEVEVDDAKENKMSECDAHFNDYTEFTVDEVKPEQITNIYIPEVFKGHFSEELIDGLEITWCGMKGKFYGDKGLTELDPDTMNTFVETAHLSDSKHYNYFRGKFERKIFDVYEINYIF